MEMGFRWYGEHNDKVTLSDIKQIPSTTGIVWSLHDVPAGELWDEKRIAHETELITQHGFSPEVIESVNVHEDIKLGRPSRDEYIENYQETIKRVAKYGVNTICYNFMPVFDWTRTDLFKKATDDSTALFFEKKIIDNIDPKVLIQEVSKGAGNMTMPGWEPEQLSQIESSMNAYKSIDKDTVWKNLQYFLEAIIPVARAYNVKMAIHPDDPPWDIFGLPRLITNRDNIAKFLSLVDDTYNGLTLCSGSLGANPDNDIPALIREFKDRIHFAHIRNVRHFDNGDFIESAHKTSEGSLDIVEIVRAYHDIQYTAYVRPDHGRHIWGEDAYCRPGYGLYDRALGAMYIWGAWDAYTKVQ